MVLTALGRAAWSRRADAAPVVLVAAVFLTTVELLRATSPLLDLTTGEIGVVGAAQLALLLFLAPVLAGPVVAVLGHGRTMVGLVVALVLLRAVAQAQDPATLPVVGAAAAVGVAALVLAVRHAPSGVDATVGVLLGTVADLAVRAALSSFDALFRPGIGPWVLLVVPAAAALAAVVVARPDRVRAPEAPGRAAAVGPYLALYVMGFGSAPIVAAHAGVSLPTAGLVLMLAALVAAELVRRMRLPGGNGAVPEPDRWFAGALAGLVATAAVAVGYWRPGPVAVVAFPLGAVAAAVLLARALTPRGARSSRRRQGRAVAAGALGAGLGYLLPVMVYQVHYDLEFPFDNRYALVAAAVMLGLAGTGRRPAAESTGWRGLLVRPAATTVLAAVALLVPVVMLVTRPTVPEPTQQGASLRLMSWNVMYGRDHTRGVPDPEAIAAAIEGVGPDVVVLQEVSRGWPIGGGTDVLEYLSRRLAMDYHWSPAADGQFGNAVLTRLPTSDVEIARLPFVQGPMHRSYLAVTLHLDDGRTLRVIATHLQHRTGNSPTRLVQSRALLDVWDGRSATVVAGDFNFWPSWEEPRVWEAAGFQSAQDVTGHGRLFTVPSDDPDNRVDWIFGTPDLRFSEFRILSDVDNSDHFPLVVTVTLPD